jgi:hypothetical protein
MFRHVVALFIVAVFCSVGWAEKPLKLTSANYDRIKMGLTIQAVTDIFGKEHGRLKDMDGDTVLVWREPWGIVNVTVKNGRVIGKARSGDFDRTASGAKSKSQGKRNTRPTR